VTGPSADEKIFVTFLAMILTLIRKQAKQGCTGKTEFFEETRFSVTTDFNPWHK
jgi:hypothetical protein